MDWLKLIIAFILCQGAGAIGAIFTARSVKTWYKTLTKPPLNPPSWIFGPVWTILYTLMAFAFTLIWQLPAETPGKGLATGLFVSQLIVNSAWSFFFFGIKRLWWAFGELVLMWILIVATILNFAALDQTAAWLLIPYLGWVTFAGYLNFSYARLNQ
jgi:tryptophan-rich sensory protein